MATGTGVAKVNEWTNKDGLTIRYNAKSWPTNVAKQTPEEATKFAVIDVDLTKIGNGLTGYPADLNNDGTTDGFDDGDFYLPANSTPLRVFAVTTEAAVGGTSFTVGTYKKDGTIISANSLITATEAVTANVDTLGKKIMGAGALVATSAGTAGVGTDNAFIAVYVTGTYTAGKVRVFIEYLAGASEV